MKIDFKNPSVLQINNLSKRQKIIFFCITALISSLIAIYLSLSTMYGKQGTISRFQSAINTKDSKTFLSLLKSSDEKLVLNDKTANVFLAYLSKYPSRQTELINTLRKQASLLDSNPNNKKDSCLNYYITLKKSGKKLLFFDNYYFEIKPCYVSFMAVYANTKLYINDKLIYTFTQDNTSYNYQTPFIAGTYKVKAVCETSLGKNVNEQTTDFICPIDNKGKVNTLNCLIQNNIKFITLSCNAYDAQVYVNGKLSNLQQSSTNIDTAINIGPINTDTNAVIYLQKNFPWGTFRSKDITITNNTPSYSTLDIDAVNDNLLNKLKLAVADYNKNVISTALKNQNPSFTGTYLYSIIDPSNISIWYSTENTNYLAHIISKDYYNQNFGTDLDNSILAASKEGITHIYNAAYDENKDTWSVMNIDFYNQHEH